jgi:hypothetical protein
MCVCKGGLQYSVIDCGIEMSIIGIILLFISELFIHKMKFSIQISPLRTLRY